MAKKQNKKESWINRFREFIDGTAYLIIVLLLLFIWGSFAYSKTDKYFCSHNPDKCVCENNLINGKIGEFEKCLKFRLKTQSELDIDDCNNNPREDSDCKCEEYEKIDKFQNNYFDLNSFFIINGSKIIVYYTKQEIENNYLVTKANQTVIFDNFSNKYQENNYFIVSVKEGYFNGSCLKSRPKTDQEKHPEDYVAEIKCIKYANKFYLNNSVETICIKNQTTYRKKTECEKGNPGWVEETTYGYEVSCDSNVAPCYRFISKNPNIEEANFMDNPFGKFIDLRYVSIKAHQTICREKNAK